VIAAGLLLIALFSFLIFNYSFLIAAGGWLAAHRSSLIA